jgi:hypothetical protein
VLLVPVSMGSSGVRRKLRAQFLGPRKNLRASRRIVPFTVEVKDNVVLEMHISVREKAREGAEKSSHSRGSHRGLRGKIGCRRARIRTSPPAHPRPNVATKQSITDRQIRRASAQMDYWKAKQRFIIDKLKRLGSNRFFKKEITRHGRDVSYPSLAYRVLRRHWRGLNDRLKIGHVWCRPFREGWSVMLDSEFRFCPPGVSPSWSTLIGPEGFLEDYVECCRDLQINTSYKGWEAYNADLPIQPSLRPSKQRSKNRRTVSKESPSQRSSRTRVLWIRGVRYERCLSCGRKAHS